jgi:hypothetical protein
MSRKINELRRSNTSGVPGLRLNRRHGVLVIDVTWWRDGRRRGTSYSAERSPIAAVRRAMERRAIEAGAEYSIGPRAAWARIQQGAMA